MNLTAGDHRREHGAWVRGQINSTRWRYSHFIYNTYPIPTAASRSRSRCGDGDGDGDGVSVVNEMTVPPSGGVNLTSDPSSVFSSVITCS